MCGIAGIFHPLPAFDTAAEAAFCVNAMNTALLHRGPDGSGIWTDPESRCVLANRRLAVIDPTAAGTQPMASADGRWMIAFNGEIYNAEELRSQLGLPLGAYRGRSDTEVLVNALARWGVDLLPKLDGMFAFAAFDTLSGDFILARDPFGEKPLYYTEPGHGAMAFASELSALQHLPGFDSTVSMPAIAELLMFEYISPPGTIYERVRKLPPGHYLHVEPGKSTKTRRYFEFKPGLELFEPSRSQDDLVDELETLLVESLELRVRSDVPLGAFLSGGIDSSVVSALVRNKLQLPLDTFSAGFEDALESEHETARLFARHLGTKHHESLFSRSSLNNVKQLGKVLDEPCADWSCLPVYLLSAFAREHVTVALSGDGGDELFAGYDRYRETLTWQRSRGGADSPYRTAGERYYSWGFLSLSSQAVESFLGFMPPAVQGRLDRLRAQIDRNDRPLLDRVRKSDVENYLPGAVLTKVDRMSMQHSLEVRTPFLNTRLARFAEKLPESALVNEGLGKVLLRRLAQRYLPESALRLPKKGFGLPNSAWVTDTIRQEARNALLDEESAVTNLVGRGKIESLLKRPKAVHRWWTLALLDSWCKHHPARLP